MNRRVEPMSDADRGAVERMLHGSRSDSRPLSTHRLVLLLSACAAVCAAFWLVHRTQSGVGLVVVLVLAVGGSIALSVGVFAAFSDWSMNRWYAKSNVKLKESLERGVVDVAEIQVQNVWFVFDGLDTSEMALIQDADGEFVLLDLWSAAALDGSRTNEDDPSSVAIRFEVRWVEPRGRVIGVRELTQERLEIRERLPDLDESDEWLAAWAAGDRDITLLRRDDLPKPWRTAIAPENTRRSD